MKGLSLPIARDLCEWIDEATNVGVRIKGVSHAAALVAGLPEPAKSFLMDAVGRSLAPSRSGMAVLLDDIAAIVAQSRLMCAMAEAAADDLPVDDLPCLPPAEPEPPPAPRVARRRKPRHSVRLCDPSHARDRLHRSPSKALERKRLLEKLNKDCEREYPIATPKSLTALTRLAQSYPNFRGVVETLADHMALAIRVRSPLRLPPLLLQGPPGIGKTAFTMDLAEALGFNLLVHSFAELTGGFILTGAAGTWTDAAPGQIARLLIETPEGKAPLLFIDEIDKVSSGNHAPDRILLGALERRTAERFRDENLELELNITPISWMFTSNDPRRIRPELRSRLQMIEVPPPTPEEMPAVVRSIDASLRRDVPALRRAFHPLDAEFVHLLSGRSPRELKRLLEAAYARVAKAGQGRGRLRLTPDAIRPSKSAASLEPGVKSLPVLLLPTVQRLH